MSYCVHCGVELDEAARRCPLCGTEVHDPVCPVPADAPEFFPTKPAEVAPVSKRMMGLLLTSMLASVAVCCIALNFFLRRDIPWSLYVVGATVMVWVWTAVPMLLRKLPLWIRLVLDVAAVGLYVWLISLALSGEVWFRGLAVPLILFSTVTVGVLGWLLRHGHSVLTTAALVISAAGIFCVGVEICCDLFLHGAISLSWSLVALACSVGFCIPLIVVRRVPSLREEVRRRFHF